MKIPSVRLLKNRVSEEHPLREFLRKNGIKATVFADEIGVSVSALSLVLNGHRSSPRVRERIDQIARAWGVI